MSIDALSPLIGTWEMTGRSDGSDTDDVTGRVTIEPILDGTVLRIAGTLAVGELALESVELIWADPQRGDFAAHAYSTLGPPSPYRWARTGPDTLTHAGNGATYTGTIGDGGRTIAGAWEPDPGTPRTPATAYATVMRKVG